jgi:RNA polymerase sigma factor (sigma-70 family)
MEINPNLTEKGKYDYELVLKAMNNGDQKAYAELMSRYRDMVYFMMLKMVNNRDDADDLTIEAFGKAFRNLHQYTPNFAFSTWLFRIATNNAIDFIRKKKGNTFSIDKSFDDGDGGEFKVDLKSDDLDPEENLIKKQKNILIKEIVDGLKPRYKELIELRYYKELSYEEISVQLNIPIGTVKALLFRAREVLYNILKDSHGEM